MAALEERFDLPQRSPLLAYAKHAEVTMSSLADREKDWQKHPLRYAQPKLLRADSKNCRKM